MADHVFICYAREDKDFVLKLATNLKQKGVPVWLDQWDIPAGANWNRTIDEALYECAQFLIVLSPEAVESRRVEGEWVTALEETKTIVPVLYRECRIPSRLRLIQRVDFINHEPDDSTALEQILRVLDMKVSASPKPEMPEGAEPRKDAVPDVIRAERGGYELVRIPGGSFTMGSPESEEGREKYEGPQHEVHVPEFYMGRYPVTNEEYGRFLKENPDVLEPAYWTNREFNQPRQPVVGVSWDDAKDYAEWSGLRLPSEAEWEYACRAGTSTRFFTGDKYKDLDRAGWYFKNSGKKPHPVGEKEPNAFGLYDMHGNVWEWIEDTWHENYKHAPNDGRAWEKRLRGSDRVIRGGFWLDDASYCRSAIRAVIEPHYRDFGVGFRLSRSVALGP